MGVFDTDLVQKDLSLEDRIREKITSVVEHVMYSINERSAHGIISFDRLTEPGTLGIEDTPLKKSGLDRYQAFLDYLYVNLEILRRNIKMEPIIQDNKRVIIKSFRSFSNYYSSFNSTEPFTVHVGCVVEWKTGIFSFMAEDYSFTFCPHLDPPTCPPEGLHFPFVI